MPSGRLPPRTPDEPDLDGAVSLCGIAARKGVLRLTMYERETLARICGRVPENKTEAQRWKIGLRALRKEVEAEPDPEVAAHG